MKKLLLFLTFSFLFVAAEVFAQEEPTEPVCGDSIVQFPEKCDEGGVDTATCTAECGQKLIAWSWASNMGWASLNDATCSNLAEGVPAGACSQQNITYFTQLTTDNQLQGWAWSDTLGWICFGQTCNDYGQGIPPIAGVTSSDVVARIDLVDGQITGWGKFVRLGDDGWLSLNCSNDGSSCLTSDYQALIEQTFVNGLPSYVLRGWGWNNRVGWLRFDPDIITIQPWLQTKYGDIYAKGGLRGEESPDYNATYRILSGRGEGSIVHFRSAKGTEFWVSERYGPINFPTPETLYSNVLGKLDITALTCNFGGGTSCINSYGNTVVNLNASGQQLGANKLLGGNVYYHSGDLTINNQLTFLSGIDFQNGAGTIVVDGDLLIENNVLYQENDNLNSLRNLPVVAWIVRGDLKISPNVGQLAGNFVVIGDGAQSCSDAIDIPSCGQVYSCANLDGNSPAEQAAACAQQRLSISGLVMARKFYLDRTYTGNYETPSLGSEIIVYDGRLLANTPPGLGDFAKTLPIWRSAVFSR